MPLQANYWSQVLLMNEYQRIRVCDKIVKYSQKIGNNVPICLMGLAFKGDVSDTRCSNAIFVLSYLLRNKVNVKLYDPYVKEEHNLIAKEIIQVFEDIQQNKMKQKILSRSIPPNTAVHFLRRCGSLMMSLTFQAIPR